MVVLTACQKCKDDDVKYSMEMVAVNSKENLYTMRLYSTKADEAWSPITTIMTVEELELISSNCYVKDAYMFAKLLSQGKQLFIISATVIIERIPMGTIMPYEEQQKWFKWHYDKEASIYIDPCDRLEDYVYMNEHNQFEAKKGWGYDPETVINFTYQKEFDISILSKPRNELEEFVKEQIKDEITPLLKEAYEKIKAEK